MYSLGADLGVDTDMLDDEGMSSSLMPGGTRNNPYSLVRVGISATAVALSVCGSRAALRRTHKKASNPAQRHRHRTPHVTATGTIQLVGSP
jgi:hypothetical protein